MLLGVTKGVALYAQTMSCSNIQMCFESTTMDKCVIGAQGYTIGLFMKEEALSPLYKDMIEFLSDAADRSPYIDFLSETELDEITKGMVTLFGRVSYYREFFTYVIKQHGIMVSFPTSDIWGKPFMPFMVVQGNPSSVVLKNISGPDVSGIVGKKEPDTRFLLDDSSRYKRTRKLNKASVVYQEIQTGRYWYLDDFHKNHFEVFSPQGDHLGEASLETGLVNEKARDGRKRFKI